MYYITDYKSPLCNLTIASDGENIIGLWMEGQKYYCATVKGEIKEKNDLPVFTSARDWLDRYFSGEKPSAKALPLAPTGGDFRKTVWNILTEIPYGEFITYGDIAKLIDSKTDKVGMSSRAVGGAVGHNPISIIIPCHRVIGANGKLTGYAGGIDKKIKLLEHEGVDMSRLSVPSQK